MREEGGIGVAVKVRGCESVRDKETHGQRILSRDTWQETVGTEFVSQQKEMCAQRGQVLAGRGTGLLAGSRARQWLQGRAAGPLHRNSSVSCGARECVVFDVEAAVLDRDVRLALLLVRAAGHAGRHLAVAVRVDDDAVLGELLLDEDHLLRALQPPEMPPMPYAI